MFVRLVEISKFVKTLETSPEVQNRGPYGSIKKIQVLQIFFKKSFLKRTLIKHPTLISHWLVSFFLQSFQ